MVCRWGWHGKRTGLVIILTPRSTEHNEVQLLVRACQSRTTTDQGNWLKAVRATPCLYTSTVNVSRRKPKIAVEPGKREMPRDARIAEVEVRSTTVTLRPPYRPDRKLPEVTVNVVLVEEMNPPQGVVPIQWLYSNPANGSRSIRSSRRRNRPNSPLPSTKSFG